MITIMVTVSLVKDPKVEVMVNLKKDSAVLLAALVGAATGKENLTKDTVVHHLHHLAAGVVMEKVKVANRIPILHGAVLALVKAKGTVIHLLAPGAVTEKARVTIQQVHLVQGKAIQIPEKKEDMVTRDVHGIQGLSQGNQKSIELI